MPSPRSCRKTSWAKMSWLRWRKRECGWESPDGSRGVVGRRLPRCAHASHGTDS